jgi:hypothetical protein
MTVDRVARIFVRFTCTVFGTVLARKFMKKCEDWIMKKTEKKKTACPA